MILHPGEKTPTLEQACEAGTVMLDATDKLFEHLRNRREAQVMGLPDRQLAIDDIDAEVAFIQRKLDAIRSYTRREREINGW